MTSAPGLPPSVRALSELAADHEGFDVTQGPGDIGEGFDAVGLFDVIEHLDQPREAIELGLSRLRPGGWLVGTVPAMMALWSEVDASGGHRLRDETATLRPVLTLEGARLHEIISFNRLLVLPLWLQRKEMQDKPVDDQVVSAFRVCPAPLNQLASWLLRLEYRSGSLWSLMGVPGASLWFALQKR